MGGATVIGGGSDVSYKFLLRTGNTWSTLRDYSTSPTIDWAAPSAGHYAIRVLARSAGSTNAYDAIGEISDQTLVSVSSPKVATVAPGVFTGGVYYICESDRTCGLRVIGGPSVARLENVTVTGTVGTDANGEKVLQVSSVDSRASGVDLGTLGMVNKNCSSSGQLVRVWGKVTSIGGGSFTVDDGNGLPVKVDTSGLVSPISVNVQTGNYVAATGLAGKGTGGITVVRPRSDSDIQVY